MERKTDITIIEYDSASLDQKSPKDSAIIRRLIITAFPGKIAEFVSLRLLWVDRPIGVSWGRFVCQLAPSLPLQVIGISIVHAVVSMIFFLPIYLTLGFYMMFVFPALIGYVVAIFSSQNLFGSGGYYLV